MSTDLRARESAQHLLRRAWVAPAVLFSVSAAIYAVSSTVPALSLDVWSTYFLSWQLAGGGGPWVDGVTIPRVTGHVIEYVWVLEAPNGHLAVGRSPGAVLAGLPAYWLLGGEVASTLPGGLTAALLTAVTVTLFFLSVRSRLGVRAALWSSAVLGFTTPVWSVAANGIWPHTVTILGIAGMGWAGHRERWWLVGLFGGVVVWGRVHAAVIVAVVGLGVAWSRRSPRVAATVGGVSLVLLGLLCIWDRWMYGSWSPTASYDVGLFAEYAVDNRLDLMNHVRMWLSADRGILVWTPVIGLLAPALVRSWRRLPDWSRWLLAGGLVYTVLQAFLNRHTGGVTFFPYRLGLEFVACAAPALALSVREAGPWARRLLVPVVVLQLFAILLGSGLVPLPFVLGGE